MEGFSYNGKHSDDFHCYFIPDESDRWFASPDFEVFENSDTGKDGGYFYGTKAKVRSFALKCFYEDITIIQREALRRWLDRNTSGELIFDRRPFVHYNVRPTKIVQGKTWNSFAMGTNEELYNGTFTITFSAYQPYGILNYKDYTDFDTEGAALYCGMLEHDMMPPAPATTDTSFLIYNCGTQKCHPIFRISGTADAGLAITNLTNNTTCQLTGLPSTGYLEIDGNLGSVTWVHGTERELAFSYHMSGFIVLEPYMACEDEVLASYSANSTTITQPNGAFDDRYVNKYIYLDGGWNRIASVTNGGDAVLESAVAHTRIESAKVVTMNQLAVTGENLALTRLEVDYAPKIV